MSADSEKWFHVWVKKATRTAKARCQDMPPRNPALDYYDWILDNRTNRWTMSYDDNYIRYSFMAECDALAFRLRFNCLDGKPDGY